MITLTTSYQMISQKYIGSSYGDLYIRAYAKYITQEISNNRTKVVYQARAYFSGNYIIDKQASGKVSGTSASSVSGAFTQVNKGELVIATTSEVWISHDSDGSKNVTASAYLSFPNWGWSGTAEGEASLPTIPRGATITDAPNFHDEENPTIKYSNPAGDAVTSLEACISLTGATADVPYRDIPIDGISYTFELTDDERTTLRKATTGSNSRSVIFYIRTVIGGSTIHSTLKKMLSIIDGLPTLLPQVKDINENTIALTGNEETLVKNHSIAEVSTGAQVYKEATISSQKITCGSKVIEEALGMIEGVESGTFAFSATDNRNNTVTETIAKEFVEYVNLTCDLNITAPDADGDITFSVTGKCFDGSFGIAENIVKVYYRYKVADGAYCEWIQSEAALHESGYIAEISLSGLDYTKRHTFQAYAEDLIMSVESVEKTVSTIPLFDWGEEDFRFNIITYLKEAFIQVDGVDTGLLDWIAPQEGVIGAENNVFGVDIPYYKIGKLAVIIINALKMNKIPSVAAWNATEIATLPDEIVPAKNSYHPVVIDKCFFFKDTSGVEKRLNSSYAIMVNQAGEMHWVTRYAAADFTTLTNGYGIFATVVYITK